jgi:hypothetical protein
LRRDVTDATSHVSHVILSESSAMAATGGDVPKVDEATNVFASPAEFVKASGGTTCINRLLICNNGIAVSIDT